MKQYHVKQYQATDYTSWNTLVSESKNGTFLFDRNFMEYHNNRFEDFSLMVYEGDKLVCVLPANRVGDTVYSHQGLTYGGLVYSEKIKLAAVISIFSFVLQFLKEKDIFQIQIKTIPSIYHIKPAEEFEYALFLTQSKLIRRDTLSVIDLRNELSISKGRMEGVNKGLKNNLKIMEEPNFDLFWNSVLIPNLEAKHQAKPVHTLEEIKELHIKFPKNIRQFNVYQNNIIVAGTTIFESNQVAHAQYISANEDKNALGSLDFLYHYLLSEVFKNKKYFDFGISNENQGKNLNNGLHFWKESFGASTIVQDFYEVETANFNLLENVIL